MARGFVEESSRSSRIRSGPFFRKPYQASHTHTCVCVRACVCVYTWRCCDCTVVHGEGSLRLNNEVLPFMISRLVKRHLIVAHSVGLTAKHMRVSTVHVWLDGIKWQ